MYFIKNVKKIKVANFFLIRNNLRDTFVTTTFSLIYFGVFRLPPYSFKSSYIVILTISKYTGIYLKFQV